MKRDYNTDKEGRLFSDDIVETIWQKAHKNSRQRTQRMARR